MGSEVLPSGWRIARLGEIGEVNRGRSRHRPRYAEHLYGGRHPFIQTGDIKSSGGRITRHSQTYSEAGLAQSRLWPAGTLCITIAANIAETAVLTYPACFPDSVVGFVADESKCEVFFIEYVFRHLRRSIQHEASGSVQDNINLDTLGRLSFSLPPPDEQREIVSVLKPLDDRIFLNEEMNQTLEAMARAIFKSWFVDFDPVRGGHPLFPRFLGDSILGPIPEGWQIQALGSVATVNERSISRDYPYESIEYVDISSVSLGRLEGTTQFELTAAPSRARQLVASGDTIWSCVRPNRRSFLYIWNPPQNMIVSTGFAVLSPKGIPSSYLYSWVTTDDFVDFLTASADGSAYPAVRPARFAEAKILVPPEKVLKAFHGIVGPLRAKIAANDQESRTLAALRDALLPKLLSGEIRVKQAEKIVGEAV